MRIERAVCVAIISVGLAACPSPAPAQSAIGQIDGSADLVGVRGIAVPPVKRSETSSLVDLGTIDTDGYERIVLNLAGQMQAVDEAGGPVGVVLIPDTPPFDRAFTGMGLLPASLEITLTVSSETGAYFLAPQQKFDVGFPRYRALAYNNTRSPMTISFFAYRSR
jgi:hypothetical protein